LLKHVFFYGTLKKKEKQDEIIPGMKLNYRNSAKIKAKLFDLGEFPGAIIDENSYTYGEIYENINNGVLEKIDEYEGVDFRDKKNSLFLRDITTAELEDGQKIQVYVYLYNQSTDSKSCIETGIWDKT